MSHSPPRIKRRKAMDNKDRYEQDIKRSNPDYRVTIRAFREWLTVENMQETFNEMLRDRELTLYDIALDFSIPVAMVKYFKKSA